MTDFAEPLFAGRTGRERNPLRILLWLVLTLVLTFVFCIPLAVLLVLGPLDPEMMMQVSEGGSLPEGARRLQQETAFMAFVSGSLVAAAAAGLLAARAVFRRPISSFLTPAAPFRFRLLLLGLGVFAVLVGIAVALDPWIGGEPLDPPVLDPSYPASNRLLYAGAAVILLLFAAAAEEVFFRGVVLQLSGAFTRNAILLCLINGLLFSAIHVDFDPASFLARTALGAAFTWTVLKLGGLEFAIGAHAANNIILCWFGAPLSEAADITQDPPPIYAVVDAVLCVAMVLIVLWLSRRESVRRWTGRPAG